MKKTYKIKYIPTGNVFEDFTKEQCDELLKEDPNNFEVLDANYKMPAEEVQESTVLESIVDNSDESEEDEETSDELDGENEEIEEDEVADESEEDEETSDELDGENEETPAKEAPKPISRMNVKELIAYCEKNNIKVDESMKRADILAVIKGAE